MAPPNSLSGFIIIRVVYLKLAPRDKEEVKDFLMLHNIASS